jgi:hypothetical protein
LAAREGRGWRFGREGVLRGGGEEEERRRRMLTATSDGTGKLWSIPPSSTSFTLGCLSRGTDTPPVVAFGLAPVIVVLFLGKAPGPQARGSEDSEFFSDFGKGIRDRGSRIPRGLRALLP